MSVEQLKAQIADLRVRRERLVELEAKKRELEGGQEWRANPVTLANHLTNGRLKLWRYAMFLGEKFRQAVRGEDPFQIWNLPSRYGKSLWASQWGPAWALDDNPALKMILVSYGDELADENAVAVRDILRNHAGVLRAELRRDRQRQDRFVTTEGGGILAAGILSAITGFGAGGAVVDDPLKNWQEAHSAARRDLVWNNYRSVVRLRLEEEVSWLIVVHTRWHQDDPTGRLAAEAEKGTGDPFTIVRLPAIAEECDPASPDPLLRVPDPLGREPGEVLEPERFSRPVVLARQAAIGSYLSASMEQQRPSPEEGGELKRAWWRLDDTMPTVADEWLTSWDMKLKDRETGDYVVGQCWARTGKDFWLVEQLRGQWGLAMTCNAICLLAVRHPDAARHVIENTGNGPEVLEALRQAFPDYVVDDDTAGQLAMTPAERQAVQATRRRGMNGLIPENPKGSKPSRARATVPYLEAGDVHLWAPASWLPAFLEETAAFPNGSHDDQVDAYSQAIKYLAKGPATLTAPGGVLPSTRPAARPPRTGMGSSVVLPSALGSRRRNGPFGW